MISFYLEHNPEKLSSVDGLLERYAGKENELIRQLERKYEGRGGGPWRREGGGAARPRAAEERGAG